MTYGNGWPFSEMPDGYALEAQDEADAEQAAHEDRAADHARAVPFVRLNAEPLRVRADYLGAVVNWRVVQ
jgi:hypothetical protein